MLEVIYNEMYGVCQPDGLIPEWISNYFYKNHDDIMSDGFCCKLYVSQYQFIDDLIIFLKLTDYYTPHVKFFYHERECFKVKQKWNTIDFYPYKFRDELDKAKYRYDMMPNKISTYPAHIEKKYVEETGHYQYEFTLSS